MIKSELTDKIAHKMQHLPIHDIALCVNKLLEDMCQALVDDKRIEIRGFGSFDLHYCKPRNAHNPKTGERLITSGKHRLRFKPGKELRDRVNKPTSAA